MGRKRNVKVEENYIVEKIVGHRQDKNGKFEYYLKWENYPSETNTWEPEDHLYCHELLAEYKKKMMIMGNGDTVENKMEDSSKERTMKKRRIENQENTSPKADNSMEVEMSAVESRFSSTDNNSIKSMEVEKTALRGNQLAASGDRKSRNKNNNDETFDSLKNRPVPNKGNEAKENSESIVGKTISLDDKKTSKKTGFDRNLEPEKIVSAKQNTEGKIMFLMSWKGTSEIDEIPANEANIKCPQCVIDFYERRILWNDKQWTD